MSGQLCTNSYDDFGRRTHESSSAGETTFTWDSLGRLTGIASEESTSTYEYGPTGMRERAVVESANTTTTTECVWSGGTLVASRVSETQGGTTTVTDYRYLYGPDSLPLEMIVTPLGGTPSAYTFQCDRSGSVIALTDATGAAVATYAYDPWGAVLEAPESGIGARNPLRYRGYYFDDATGLYYLPARYYDPATARFLSPDPAPPSAGDPLSLNRYAYCAGDPVNADDPSGAVMVQGSGVTTRVSDAAVELAHKGRLTAAKDVQSYFRDAVSRCYVQGYSFEDANRIAKLNTDNYAVSRYRWALEGDGTPFGRGNHTWMPSAPTDVTWGMAIFGTVGDAVGLVAPHPVLKVVGLLASVVVDVCYLPYAYDEWKVGGQATAGDYYYTYVGVLPLVGSPFQLGVLVGDAFAREVFGVGVPWAEPMD